MSSHVNGNSTADNYNCNTETIIATSDSLPNNLCQETMELALSVEVRSGYDQVFDGISFPGQPVHENLFHIDERDWSQCSLPQDFHLWLSSELVENYSL